MTTRGLADNIAANRDKVGDYSFIKRMEDNILDLRALFIRREYSRDNVLSPSVIQDLDNLALQETDDIECEGDIDVTVMRTVARVPNPIRIKNGKLGSSFTFVGSNDRTESMTYIDPEDLPGLMQTKFINRLGYYAYLNKYIYIYNSKSTTINIRAAFGDPRELRKLKNCSGGVCFTGDFELEQDLSNAIEKEIYTKLDINIPEPEEIKIDDDTKS
ncbi:hypothetical protein LCGC14_0246460 [marine sediment metagenome]|uniref:Uncharacterized protein n=1 Tax=marine sediment metagenome TaxID=412755 RepID=A0A0F9U6A7_9ZZZZ